MLSHHLQGLYEIHSGDKNFNRSACWFCGAICIAGYLPDDLKLIKAKRGNVVSAVTKTIEFGTGTHFTNDFSITIQIRWKFH